MSNTYCYWSIVMWALLLVEQGFLLLVLELLCYSMGYFVVVVGVCLFLVVMS